MTFAEFFKQYNRPYLTTYDHKYNKFYINRCPVIICNDGYIISIQAGKGSCSIPSENVNFEEYSAFEINSLNYIDVNIQEYQVELSDEDKKNQIVAVYHYVPIEDIEFIIDDHGGISQDYINYINKELNKDNIKVDAKLIPVTNVRHPCQIAVQYLKKGK